MPTDHLTPPPRDPRDRSRWPTPTTPRPPIETMQAWIMDAELPEATDGCTVEPDGMCEHGHPSWLLRLGVI